MSEIIVIALGGLLLILLVVIGVLEGFALVIRTVKGASSD